MSCSYRFVSLLSSFDSVALLSFNGNRVRQKKEEEGRTVVTTILPYDVLPHFLPAAIVGTPPTSTHTHVKSTSLQVSGSRSARSNDDCSKCVLIVRNYTVCVTTKHLFLSLADPAMWVLCGCGKERRRRIGRRKVEQLGGGRWSRECAK